jgi:hypothetical protein
MKSHFAERDFEEIPLRTKRDFGEIKREFEKDSSEKLKKDKYIFVKSHFEDEERLRRKHSNLKMENEVSLRGERLRKNSLGKRREN